MAGPATESIMFNQGADDETLFQWVLTSLRSRIADANEWDEFSDYNDAGPYVEAALPMALAIVSGAWERVEVIARAALEVDPLPYAAVVDLVGPRLSVDMEQHMRWSSLMRA